MSKSPAKEIESDSLEALFADDVAVANESLSQHVPADPLVASVDNEAEMEVEVDSVDNLTEAVIAVATNNSEPNYTKKLLSYISKNLESLAKQANPPSTKRLMVIMNLYQRVAENVVNEQHRSRQELRKIPPLEVIVREIEILGSRLQNTVKNYLTDQLLKVTTEIGSNTSAIAESQENAQKDHAAILALMQEGIPNNLATRLTAVEEVGIHLDEKVSEVKNRVAALNQGPSDQQLSNALERLSSETEGLASRTQAELVNVRSYTVDAVADFESKFTQLKAQIEGLTNNGFDLYSSAHHDLKREADLLKSNFENMDTELHSLAKKTEDEVKAVTKMVQTLRTKFEEEKSHTRETNVTLGSRMNGIEALNERRYSENRSARLLIQELQEQVTELENKMRNGANEIHEIRRDRDTTHRSNLDLARKVHELEGQVERLRASHLENNGGLITNLSRQVAEISNLVTNQNAKVSELANDLTALKNPAERSRLCTPPSQRGFDDRSLALRRASTPGNNIARLPMPQQGLEYRPRKRSRSTLEGSESSKYTEVIQCTYRPHISNDYILIDSTLLSGFFPAPITTEGVGLSAEQRARMAKADVRGAEMMQLEDPVFNTSHNLCAKLSGMYNILHTVYTEMYDMRSPMSLHNHAIFWEESGIAHVAAAMLQIRGKILKARTTRADRSIPPRIEAFNIATREMSANVRDTMPNENKDATPRNFPQTVIQPVTLMKNAGDQTPASLPPPVNHLSSKRSTSAPDFKKLQPLIFKF